MLWTYFFEKLKKRRHFKIRMFQIRCLYDNSEVRDQDNTGHRNPMALPDREEDHLHHVVCHHLPSGRMPGRFQLSRKFLRFFRDKRNRNLCQSYRPAGQGGYGQISRSGASGFIQGIFQLLNSTGDRVGRICDSVGLLRILRVISAF